MLTHIGDLEMFSAVVAAGSMSEAARKLGVTPAVVSKAVRRLEASLGARLLHRTTRQVVATDIGETFHRKVGNILELIQEAEAVVSGHSSDISGQLRISAPTSFGRLHVAPHLPIFMERHPRLNVDIVLSDDFSDIIAEGFDMAIRISIPKDSALIARRLAPVRRILCASPAYVARRGNPNAIEDLRDHTCIRPHNGDAWSLVGPYGGLVYRPDGRLRTNSSEVVREAAISGMGIALRSTWDIGSELSAGQLIRVLPEYEGSRDVSISAIYASRQYLPPKIRSFIDFLLEIYGDGPYWDKEN